MITDLKNFECYCVVSKLTKRVLSLNHGTSSHDLTTVKRGARYNHNLEWLEAYYIALDRAGLLAPFHHYVEKSNVCSRFDGLSEPKVAIRNCEQWKKHALQRGDTKSGEMYDNLITAYKICLRVEADADAVYESFNGKLVHWDLLTGVQFYKYDAANNEMVTFDHRTPKKPKKGKP